MFPSLNQISSDRVIVAGGFPFTDKDSVRLRFVADIESRRKLFSEVCDSTESRLQTLKSNFGPIFGLCIVRCRAKQTQIEEPDRPKLVLSSLPMSASSTFVNYGPTHSRSG